MNITKTPRRIVAERRISPRQVDHYAGGDTVHATELAKTLTIYVVTWDSDGPDPTRPGVDVRQGQLAHEPGQAWASREGAESWLARQLEGDAE